MGIFFRQKKKKMEIFFCPLHVWKFSSELYATSIALLFYNSRMKVQNTTGLEMKKKKIFSEGGNIFQTKDKKKWKYFLPITCMKIFK